MSIDVSPTPEQSSQTAGLFSVVYFGRRCRLSLIPLRRLASPDVKVGAVFLPSSSDFGPAVRRIASRPTIPLGVNRVDNAEQSIDHIAYQNNIPLYTVHRPLSHELESVLRQVSPDLIVVSCFPWRIPQQALQTASHGAINLHPSLLPRFRGPDPLFWAFRTGTRDWGVTVHQMTDALDSGPILGQRRFEVPDGIGGDELEDLVARQESHLLQEILTGIRAGAVSGTSQDESQATYLTFPRESDLVIRPAWSVKHALNFVTGVIPLGYFPLVETGRGVFEVTSAFADTETTFDESEAWRSENVVRLALLDGDVEFTVKTR